MNTARTIFHYLVHRALLRALPVSIGRKVCGISLGAPECDPECEWSRDDVCVSVCVVGLLSMHFDVSVPRLAGFPLITFARSGDDMPVPPVSPAASLARVRPRPRCGMASANLLTLVKQQSEQLGALVDAERRRREEEERAARASARALEQKEIAAARAANPPPTMPPILARRPSCGARSSSKTDHLSLTVMQSQNRLLREAVLTANQQNAERKKELEKERTAASRKLAPPPVPPPRRARSAAQRVPAAAYQYELRKLRAEFAVAQRDSVVLQAEQALLLRALHKAADTRQAHAEMRDRQSESERRAHTPPPAASAPRRRRR